MDVFALRQRIVDDYRRYIDSFINVADERIAGQIRNELDSGLLWPEPLIQMNPAFEQGDTIDRLVRENILHPACERIFSTGEGDSATPIALYRHQAEAVRIAHQGHNYVLTTGTGSGKSLSYIIPIVDHVLRTGSGSGVKALVVYPMNALANSQSGELAKFLGDGSDGALQAVTFKTYTGQESRDEKKAILDSPPDILLTNYVMLELIMTRAREEALVRAAGDLRFLVFDELHTYRGRQGADVAMLIRRVRERLSGDRLQCVGTSATMSSGGTYDERRARVADVATKIFGVPVLAEHVVGETLRPVTTVQDTADPSFVARLTERVAADGAREATDFESFIGDPLTIWLENTFGLRREPETSRLVRAEPIGVAGENGASARLSALTGLDPELCAAAIRGALLDVYRLRSDSGGVARPFEFRLHQFISRGDTVYASLDPAGDRYITLNRQSRVPSAPDRVLRPLVFCRECGQEYYSVRRVTLPDGTARFDSRELQDQFHTDGNDAGFLYASARNPWPTEPEEIVTRVPDEWVDDVGGRAVVRRSFRERLPTAVDVGADGRIRPDGIRFHFVAAPFRFCLNCGVSYGTWQKDDYMKLGTLSSEGRSTSTTILSLTTVEKLRETDIDAPARKLLSFTDNRQDASLQAGHFNDFVEVAALRAALYRAVADAGDQGIYHHQLTDRIFDAFALPFAEYAREPNARFHAKMQTERALRSVLGYRIYRDQRRGWRVTQPNLEQCGLLTIEYLSLDDLAAWEQEWSGRHDRLAAADPSLRREIMKTLLDYMRRELSIDVEFLNVRAQESIRHQSYQHLNDRWRLEEGEQMVYSTMTVPAPRGGDDQTLTYLTPRGGFGLYLKRKLGSSLPPGELGTIIDDLVATLALAGVLTRSPLSGRNDGAVGYQLAASAMLWRVGDGKRAFHDPIRVPRLPDEYGRTNPFFIELYRSGASHLARLHAHEHTAQVPYEERKKREDQFKDATLPVLFCSPTMELGVDIAQLNVVNMRNVPPTPANYAQRSGRAGRGAQPALVYTYCTTGSPHDQYFFKRPGQMVGGVVTPPKLDLANEDLLRAHIHAIWLAESGLDLGNTPKDLLDLSDLTRGSSLPVRPEVRSLLADPDIRARANRRAAALLETIGRELDDAPWYHAGWLGTVLERVDEAFDAACNRWRELYRTAHSQVEEQHVRSIDPKRNEGERRRADRLRQEAREQLGILTASDDRGFSDFYSYRYFASEGFIPGYNFPRLPLSAFIPAAGRSVRDEYLSRPRFLAISEFGPRAIVYHEGAQYIIERVMMSAATSVDDGIRTNSAKLCAVCGYLHPITDENNPDRCEHCGAALRTQDEMSNLFQLRNVSTRRRERISSDEEERMRMGYEIITSVRFVERSDRPPYAAASVVAEEDAVAEMQYGDAAEIWRINRGWARRSRKEQLGFVIDSESGLWAKNENTEAEDAETVRSQRTERVIPYVKDRRNCLLFEPTRQLPPAVMVSLQAALKSAIQVRFQLEDSELGIDLLPGGVAPRLLMFYEASEGGAGVLRRLIEEPDALRTVAASALEICHFDPDTGEDRHRAPHARENCGGACYDCLLNYGNQRFHDELNRFDIREILLELRRSTVVPHPAQERLTTELLDVSQQASTDLSRRWLHYAEERSYRLPSMREFDATGFSVVPDFHYPGQKAAIFVGERDEAADEEFEDRGWEVVRFGPGEETWENVFARYGHLFGEPTAVASPSGGNGREESLDFDLFDDVWHEQLRSLSARPDLSVEAGGDLEHGGVVVGSYLARIESDGRSVYLVDDRLPDLDRVLGAFRARGLAAILVHPGREIDLTAMGEETR